MRTTDKMDRLLLAAVSHDFVTMEHIIDALLLSDGRSAFDTGDLHRRFRDLIGDKLVNACLLHAEPPYITPMEIGCDALWSCWFYITQRGRKCLAYTDRKQTDRNRYTSAINF